MLGTELVGAQLFLSVIGVLLAHVALDDAIDFDWLGLDCDFLGQLVLRFLSGWHRCKISKVHRELLLGQAELVIRLLGPDDLADLRWWSRLSSR